MLNASLEREKQKDQQLAELQNQLKELLSQLAWFKRKMFGSISEKYPNITPLPGLFAELSEQIDSLADSKASEQELEQVVIQKKVKPRNPRQESMEGLPVVESIIEPKDIDFTKYKRIGEEHTKVIEFEPGKLFVLDIVRPKYALINQSNIDGDMPAIVIAPMPLLPIYKGSAGSTLIAELLLQKYVHHLPFYRQTKQFKELGLKLSATTINDWFASSCDLIKPLYEKIRETVLSSNYLQADETTLPVINREKKRADKEYLWMARAVKEKLLFFDYRDGSRSIKAVREIFKDFKGTLQTDGYCAYEIFDKDPAVTLINCWAHCRRNYEASLVENKTLAQYALGQIQLLYKLERIIKDKQYSPVQIEAERQRLALPIIKEMEKWIEQNYKTVLPKSRIGKAMSYNYSRIQELSRYVYDGNLQIDNNLAENALRPVTVSRKNFLHCGNHNAASNAAIIFTITGCCREQNINTRHYLIDVLNQLPNIINKKESLESLMPDKWIKQHPESLLRPDSSKID